MCDVCIEVMSGDGYCVKFIGILMLYEIVVE